MDDGQWLKFNFKVTEVSKPNKLGVLIVIVLLAGFIGAPCITVAYYLLNK